MISLEQDEKIILKEINIAEKLSEKKYAKKIVMERVPAHIYERKKVEIKEFLRKKIGLVLLKFLW